MLNSAFVNSQFLWTLESFLVKEKRYMADVLRNRIHRDRAAHKGQDIK